MDESLLVRARVPRISREIAVNPAVSVWAAGDGALARQRWFEGVAAWSYIAARAAAAEALLTPPPEGADPAAAPASETYVSDTSVDWSCVARVETGGDVSMHGATYSTEFGVINDIVVEYASPAVASAIFSGTATEAQELDVVVRFAADHGTGGWGWRTRQLCGL